MNKPQLQAARKRARIMQNVINHVRQPRKIQQGKQRLLHAFMAGLPAHEQSRFLQYGWFDRLRNEPIMLTGEAFHLYVHLGRRDDTDWELDAFTSTVIDCSLDLSLRKEAHIIFEGVQYNLTFAVWKTLSADDELTLRKIGVIRTETIAETTETIVSCQI